MDKNEILLICCLRNFYFEIKNNKILEEIKLSIKHLKESLPNDLQKQNAGNYRMFVLSYLHPIPQISEDKRFELYKNIDTIFINMIDSRYLQELFINSLYITIEEADILSRKTNYIEPIVIRLKIATDKIYIQQIERFLDLGKYEDDPNRGYEFDELLFSLFDKFNIMTFSSQDARDYTYDFKELIIPIMELVENIRLTYGINNINTNVVFTDSFSNKDTVRLKDNSIFETIKWKDEDIKTKSKLIESTNNLNIKFPIGLIYLLHAFSNTFDFIFNLLAHSDNLFIDLTIPSSVLTEFNKILNSLIVRELPKKSKSSLVEGQLLSTSALLFIIAHEFSHFIITNDKFVDTLGVSTKIDIIFNKLIKDFEALKLSKFKENDVFNNEIADSLLNLLKIHSDIYSSWKNEIFSDIIAFNILINIDSIIPDIKAYIYPAIGIFIGIILRINEVCSNNHKFPWLVTNSSHPPAIIRYMFFLEYIDMEKQVFEQIRTKDFTNIDALRWFISPYFLNENRYFYKDWNSAPLLTKVVLIIEKIIMEAVKVGSNNLK